MTEMNVATIEISNACDVYARILGRKPAAPTPDAIADTATSAKWEALPKWESQKDTEIAVRSGLYEIGLSGPLVVVTEASFVPGRGAFVVDARDLECLVSHHLDRYGECFFNGDVIIAERNGRRIWLFHHEGQYTTISTL